MAPTLIKIFEYSAQCERELYFTTHPPTTTKFIQCSLLSSWVQATNLSCLLSQLSSKISNLWLCLRCYFLSNHPNLVFTFTTTSTIHTSRPSFSILFSRLTLRHAIWFLHIATLFVEPYFEEINQELMSTLHWSSRPSSDLSWSMSQQITLQRLVVK